MKIPKHLLKIKLSDLKILPTLEVFQFENLKIQENNFRVLLSRMTIADGAKYDNEVIIEEKVNGYWVERCRYKAK